MSIRPGLFKFPDTPKYIPVTYVHQKTCIKMFLAALFVIATKRKVLKCSLTVEYK